MSHIPPNIEDKISKYSDITQKDILIKEQCECKYIKMTVTFQLTWTQIKDQNSISVSAIDITTQDITSSKLHSIHFIN